MRFGDGTFNVFVIGPMGVLEKERPGLSFWQRLLRTASPAGQENTVALKRALESLLAEPQAAERLGGQNWRVDIPDEQLGNAILRDVFSKIDNADLIVADLYWNRPSVYYELALAHNLGIPSILVTKSGEPVAFYFQENKIRYVPRYDAEALKEALREPLLKFLAGEADLHANPVSDFYQAPVVDISAATGLAVGYYINMVRDVLFRKGGALFQRPGIERFYVVRLPDILSRDKDEERLRDLFEKVTGEKHAELAGYNVKFDRPTSTGRPIFAAVCGNAIADLPTPLYTLTQSPRYQRIQGTLRSGGGHEAPVLKRMRANMLDAFYKALVWQVARDDLVAQNRMEILTLDELEKRLQPG